LEISEKCGRITNRAARELKYGLCVNLDNGIPLAATNFLSKGTRVILESDSSVLSKKRYSMPRKDHPDLTNVDKETVTPNSGAST
jgi:acyl CoA:acetate/3-ketoacid CoA transferase beta subunit